MKFRVMLKENYRGDRVLMLCDESGEPISGQVSVHLESFCDEASATLDVRFSVNEMGVVFG